MATKKNQMQFMPNQLAESFDKGVCLYVKMACPGFNASMDSDLVDTDADKDLIKVTKITLDAPQHKAIRSLHSQIKKYLRTKSLPIPKFMKSSYFIPNQDIVEVFERLEKFIEEHDEDLLPSLVKHYEHAKAEAKKRLKSAYDEEDYPSVQVLKNACYIAPEVLELRTPEKLKSVSPSLYAKQTKALEAKFSETLMEMRTYLRSSILEMVQHLEEKLKGKDEEGRPKVIRESALKHIEEFIESFNASRNVTNDTELQSILGKLRQVMSGASIEMVRGDEQFRAQLARSVAGINKQLTSLVGGGARKIRVSKPTPAAVQPEPASSTAA